MSIRLFVLATSCAAMAAIAAPTMVYAAAPAPRETVAPAFTYPIPNIPGKKLTAVLVTYAPGGKSPSHRHGAAFVVGYVLSGAIRSKVDNGETQVFHAGEHWAEAPGAHHVVSENASNTEPATLLAVFVADSSQDQLVSFDK